MDLKISELAESVKAYRSLWPISLKVKTKIDGILEITDRVIGPVKNVTHANKSDISVGTVRLIKDKKMFNQNIMAIKPPPNNQLI